jgi:hypothetical protein
VILQFSIAVCEAGVLNAAINRPPEGRLVILTLSFAAFIFGF